MDVFHPHNGVYLQNIALPIALHCIALQMIIISKILQQLDRTGLDPFIPST